MRSVAIEPTVAGCFVIRQRGMEQTSSLGMRKVFIPSEAEFWFATIEDARAFCWACGFTWSIRCGG